MAPSEPSAVCLETGVEGDILFQVGFARFHPSDIYEKNIPEVPE